MSPVTSSTKHRLIGLIAAVGLIGAIVGAKSFVILRYGTDLPYFDQWVKEGDMILGPFYEGTLRLKDFFIPHNEHRIAPTLVVNLGLAVAGGQWDARVQCVVNAFLFAGVILGVAGFASRACSRGWALLTAWLMVILCAFSLDWENTLGGFQSQFSFLIGFSLIAIHELLTARGFLTPRWWLGFLCALLASVSMGSGFLCLAPVAAIICFRWAASRRLSRTDGLTLLASAAVVVVGWCFRAKAPWHDSLHAKNFGDFLIYCARCMAWPLPQYPGLGVLMWLPWFVFAIRCLGRLRRPLDERSEVLLAAGLWVLLQIMVLAYVRCVGLPASRYGDIFIIGVATNLLTFSVSKGTRRRLIHGAILSGWVVLVAGSGLAAALPVWRDGLPEVSARYRECEKNVRGYLLTGNPSFLEKGEVPLPFRDWLRRILDRAAVRALMPASVRSPLRIVEDPSRSNPGFHQGNRLPSTVALDGRDYWGSGGLARPAEWVSAPVPVTRFHIWRFEMAGQAGSGDNTLRLATSEGSPLSSRIEPVRPPNAAWRSAYVVLPSGFDRIRIHAQSTSEDQWFAFSDPVEISILSEAARLFTHQAVTIFGASLVLLLLVTVAEIVSLSSANKLHQSK